MYRTVGLIGLAFRGAHVLEIAPGSGHNSLYVAHTAPAIYHLVEPNPAAITDIQKAYAGFTLEHTTPRLFESQFEDFVPPIPYDIVICENWLGSLPRERNLIRRLPVLLRPGGVLVMTLVPVSGFLANTLRKLIANCIIPADVDFQVKTDLAVKSFGPHLETIKGMTRSHVDWARDCMLNPHYLNVALPLSLVLDDIGSEMEVLGSNPSFATDWRWFKTLHGDARRFNDVYKSGYISNIHNFMDYRHVYPARQEHENAEIETLCLELHAEAVANERRMAGENHLPRDTAGSFLAKMDLLISELSDISAELADAFHEAADLLAADRITPDDVRRMRYFNTLFGRETIYLSLNRKQP